MKQNPLGASLAGRVRQGESPFRVALGTTSWASDKYGADYRYRNTGSVSDLASWTASLPSAGAYKVYAWWTAAANRASSAPCFVDHSGGTQTVYADQRSNGGQWNLLGTFQMNAGTTQVRLSCWTTSGDLVIADAVKWEKQ